MCSGHVTIIVFSTIIVLATLRVSIVRCEQQPPTTTSTNSDGGRHLVCQNATNATTRLDALTQAFGGGGSSPIDVLFLVDRSQSCKDRFNQTKDFIVFLTTYLVATYGLLIGDGYVNVDVSTFAAQTTRDVVDVDACGLNSTVEGLTYRDEAAKSTELGDALHDSVGVFLSASRPTAGKVLFVLSDGEATDVDSKNAIAAVQHFKNVGGTVFSVGIGQPPVGWYTSAGERTMEGIATDANHYACIDNWSSFISSNAQQYGK